MNGSTPDASPFLIVGLGNPGRVYRSNRHNIGFMIVDALARSEGAQLKKAQMQAIITDLRLESQRVYLAKPQTFMNHSGQAVASLTRYFRIPHANLLVVYDDLDLPLGMLRMRPEGGSGGHHGMQSIIQHLGTTAFPRLRAGIGRPTGSMDPADYVLQDFTPHEKPWVDQVIEQAVSCCRRYLAEGIQAAMNHCNPSAE